jgi:hypothetical protein
MEKRMPWRIEENHPECSGYAVVKEGGEFVACHSNEADALALYESLSVRERKIIDKAAELYEIKPHYILLRTRQRKISEPRFMVCRIFHQRFDYTLDFTASKVCVKGLDHSSVINGIKRTYSLSKYDDKFRAGLNSLFELAAVIMMERKAFTAMTYKAFTN